MLRHLCLRILLSTLLQTSFYSLPFPRLSFPRQLQMTESLASSVIDVHQQVSNKLRDFLVRQLTDSIDSAKHKAFYPGTDAIAVSNLIIDDLIQYSKHNESNISSKKMNNLLQVKGTAISKCFRANPSLIARSISRQSFKFLI